MNEITFKIDEKNKQIYSNGTPKELKAIAEYLNGDTSGWTINVIPLHKVYEGLCELIKNNITELLKS